MPFQISFAGDAGVVDCHALRVALSAHCLGKIHILAITCVSGNVHISQVIKNVKRCLAIKTIEQKTLHNTTDVANIPVYYGASEPLVVDVEDGVKDATFWHGNDGIGGASSAADQHIRNAINDTPLLDPRPTEALPAAIKIAQLCLANPQEITLVAIGPLTNIALACKLYGVTFSNSVKDITFMGGTRYGRGNANLTSEFNAFADPEALQICLQKFANKITMVGWDLTAKCGVSFEWVHQHWFVGSSDTSVGSFLALISAEIVHKSRRGPWKECGLLIPDPLAMCVVVDDSVVVEAMDYFATVELNGKRTRGMVVIDYDDLFGNKGNEESGGGGGGSGGGGGGSGGGNKEKNGSGGASRKNLRVVTSLDMAKIQQMLKESVSALSL
jgi:inosine-uridine nucleoside N-ribohydrolase